jgi:hypothetical protein
MGKMNLLDQVSRATLLGGVLTLCVAGYGGAQPIPPGKDIQGSYAPQGDCSKEPRVTLSAKDLVIQSAGKPTRLAPIDACFSCAGGARYEGIEVWVSQLGPDGNPKEPMFIFNSQEKRGALFVDKSALQGAPAPVRAVAMASPLKRCAK